MGKRIVFGGGITAEELFRAYGKARRHRRSARPMDWIDAAIYAIAAIEARKALAAERVERHADTTQEGFADWLIAEFGKRYGVPPEAVLEIPGADDLHEAVKRGICKRADTEPPAAAEAPESRPAPDRLERFCDKMFEAVGASLDSYIKHAAHAFPGPSASELGKIYAAFLRGFSAGFEAESGKAEPGTDDGPPDPDVSCAACWCNTCGNLEACEYPPFAAGKGHNIEPPPCALCGVSVRQMPREAPPACGMYIGKANGRDE